VFSVQSNLLDCYRQIFVLFLEYCLKTRLRNCFFFKNLIFVIFILFLYINVKNNFFKIKKYYFNIFLIKKIKLQ